MTDLNDSVQNESQGATEDIKNTEQEQAVLDTDTSEQGDLNSEDLDLSFLDEDSKQHLKQEVIEDKEAKRMKSLDGQVKSAIKKIDKGADISDFPDYLQKELKSRGVKKVPEKPVIDEEALINKAVARLKSEQEFETLRSQINDLGLEGESIKLLRKEYTELVDSGLSKTNALKTAIRLSNLDAQVNEAEQRGISLGRMAIPPKGKPIASKKTPAPDKMSDDEFLKWSNSQVGGQ